MVLPVYCFVLFERYLIYCGIYFMSYILRALSLIEAHSSIIAGNACILEEMWSVVNERFFNWSVLTLVTGKWPFNFVLNWSVMIMFIALIFCSVQFFIHSLFFFFSYPFAGTWCCVDCGAEFQLLRF